MTKPRVLLVVDRTNWAYDQMANYIIKELSDKYDFYKLVAYHHLKPERQTLGYKIKQPLRKIKALFDERFDKNAHYDILVYLWWFIPELMDLKISRTKELRGIFTESFPPGKTIEFEGNVEAFIDSCIKPADAIIAGNQNIFNFYDGHGFPVHYATGATNTDNFCPTPDNSTREENELRVCWTGNPNRNFKGFYDIVEPAVKLAQQKRPAIKLVTRFSGPLETLPAFYSQVDVMVNASVGDAGPGFIIDAGGCGVPTISTNAGFASEIIEDGKNGLLVERDIEKIATKIVQVFDDRELLAKMSRNITQTVSQNWGHTPRATHWDTMFQALLENRV